jgi:hypothetical protein
VEIKFNGNDGIDGKREIGDCKKNQLSYKGWQIFLISVWHRLDHSVFKTVHCLNFLGSIVVSIST